MNVENLVYNLMAEDNTVLDPQFWPRNSFSNTVFTVI